jgi:metal-responsive CopG/Arc/MetJ family transcriptional regulator
MESIMNKSDAQRILVRLPEDVKAFLDREAERNFASRNSEIIRSIRVRMETEHPKSAVG